MKTYDVEVNFKGYIGHTETYTIEADSEAEAMDMALAEAAQDLDVFSCEVIE